jgi:O-antigen/teichoic acid export membrane protein
VVGSVAAVGSRVVGRVLGLGFVVLLARRQSPLIFAEYNYLLILSAALTVITDAGVAAVAGREVARGAAELGAAYRAAFVVQLVTGLVGAVAVVGLGLVVPGPDRDLGALLLLGVLVAANSIFNLQAELLRGAGRPIIEGGIQLLAGLLQLGVGAAVLYAGGGLVGVFAALAAKQLVVVVLCQAWLPAPWSAQRDAQLSRVVFRRGLWLGGATTLATVIWRFGALVIGNVGSVAALADFAVSSRYLEVSAMISQTLGIGMLPALARRSTSSPHGIRRFTVRIAVILTVLTSLLTVPAVLFTGPITTAVFGGRYRSAVVASQVLVGVTPLVVLHYVLWYALVAERLERWVTIAAAAGATAALATIAWVVLRPTATVTAIATAIAIAVATAVLCLGLGRRAQPVDVTVEAATPWLS